MINSGRVLRTDAGMWGQLAYLSAVAVMLCAMCVQVAVAEANRPVSTEVVSSRLLPVATAEGEVLRADVAISGQVLVRLYPGTPQARVEQMLTATGTRVDTTYYGRDVLLLRLSPGQSVAGAVRVLNARPEVAIASPDRLMYPLAIPNDPMYGMQWHLPIIEAPQAWDLQTGRSDTVIAVIDSGVMLDHPDLAARIWTNPGETLNGNDDDNNGYVDDIVGWNFVERNNDPRPVPYTEPENGDNGDDGGNGDDGDDGGNGDNGDDGGNGDNGDDGGDGDTDTEGVRSTQVEVNIHHGTHAAGIIAAATNNALGVAGINWQAKIMALKVVKPDQEPRTSDCLAAIQYAVDNGADIIYLGFAGAYDPQYTPVIAEAVEAGATVVAPAPNVSTLITSDPRSWWSPICNDGPAFVDNNVIGVGGTDQQDRVAYFSARDSSAYNFIDIMAPAVNVYSTLLYAPEQGYTREYGSQSGNSMAAAVVAGVASLVAAHYPDFGPPQILSQLKLCATNIDEQNPENVGRMGAGRVNAFDCLRDIPPRLPQSVLAFDTPGDDGGSITVTWSLSPDDGGGFDDVVGYRVQRTQTPDDESSWVTIADLPAGTNSYIDSPVEDHTPYYYRIGVRDRSTELFTEATLPARARDDTAPPALEEGMLTARDVFDAEGGAIALSWGSYSAPPDFGAYRIWRSRTPFTSITGLGDPLAVITNAATKQYTDNTAVNGVEYYYAVTVRDTALPEPNEITAVTPVGPVVASPNLPVSFGPGMHMICLPVRSVEKNMGRIFGVEDPAALRLARWNPALGASGEYVVYSESPNSPFLQQELGRGFWYRTNTATAVTLSGMPVEEGNVRVPFRPGWNQLGNPYTGEMALTDAASGTMTQVHVQGRTFSLREAADRGHVRDYVWRYDPGTNSYRLISSDPNATWAERRVPRNAGFFFLAFVEGELELLNPAEVAPASVQAVPAPVVDDNHWTMRLVARTGQSADMDNFIGVHSQAERMSGVISPPLLEGSVDLSVATADGNHGATAFVQSLEGVQSWQLRVTCAEPGGTVELTWPDLSQVPSDRRLILRDLESGQSVNMRTVTGYSYQLAADQTRRQFEVICAERGVGALAVTGLQTSAETAEAAQIAFTLSQDAAVKVQILNIAGRTVRTVVADSAMTAGTNVVLWNQRSESGARVPAGRYLVSVTAHGDDGSVARVIGTLQLGR